MEERLNTNAPFANMQPVDVYWYGDTTFVVYGGDSVNRLAAIRIVVEPCDGHRITVSHSNKSEQTEEDEGADGRHEDVVLLSPITETIAPWRQFSLQPEQVAVLFDVRAIRLFRLVTDQVEELPSREILLPKPTNAAESSMSVNEKQTKTYAIARQIVLGKKAKAREDTSADSTIPAKKRKAERNFEGLEATEDEIRTEMKNLEKRHSEDDFERVRVVTMQFPVELEAKYREKIVVFRDLWRKGYLLTTGVKFGCDFLLYEGFGQHAKYMVGSHKFDCGIYPDRLIPLTRLANNVKKELLLAVVADDAQVPDYVCMHYWKSTGENDALLRYGASSSLPF